MTKRIMPTVLACVVFASGCATIVKGTSEVLYIRSSPQGALAQLSTGQSITTPGRVTLRRDTTVTIIFTKEGYEKQFVTVFPTKSDIGDILLGPIDWASGALYNLTPNPVFVTLKPVQGDVRKDDSKQVKE